MKTPSISNITQALKALVTPKGGTSRERASASRTPLTRETLYQHLYAYYTNVIYTRSLYGGGLDIVNRELGEAAAGDIAGLFNPVKRVCELYARNVFHGNFGDEIFIAETVGTERQKKPVNPRILDPLERIWKWSNINVEKERLPRLNAVLGNAGLRVVAVVGDDYPNDRLEDRRVYIQIEHPIIIDDVMYSVRGDVEQIITQYWVREGSLSLTNTALSEYRKYRDLQTAEFFEVERDGKPFNELTQTEFASASDARRPNVYGFVPYVVAFHEKLEGEWGAWAIAGEEQKIDRLNALVAHINRQIYRHINATWLVNSDGNAPKEFNFGGTRVLFFKRKVSENSTDTTVTPMVANLSLGDAINEAKFILEELRDSLPELKAIDGVFLSGQSGQTVAQLRLPAEEKLLAARANNEDALIRAQKMALSLGIVLGLWDVGTGTGSKENAQQAFQRGLLDHRFNERRALAITKAEDLETRKLETDIRTSEAELGAVTAPADNKQLPAAKEDEPDFVEGEFEDA